VALFINKNFEPVWQTVRPVPIVRIDFGNGTVLTRTLSGNVATYACTPDGQVLDILPGIYTPAAYLDRLNQLRLLANYAGQEGPGALAARLSRYHQDQAEALKRNEVPARFVNLAPVSKAAIERGIKAVLMPGKDAERMGPGVHAGKNETPPRLDSAEDLVNWKALAEDTLVNETVRRRQIHELLAGDGLTRPEGVTRRLYKEVLHADLDDPYLGLGEVLFANYPFREDNPHR
jgi:hypothetical protein